MQLATNRQSFAPTTMGEAIQFSEMLASSSMVPKAYQGRPQDILVAVQWGQELGLAPMQALQGIAVINGKPSVYGDALMAMVQASPVCENIEEYFEGEGTPNPVAVCIASRKGRKPVTVKFSVEDAKRAGLWGKQGPWTAYPKRMMMHRARGFALRDQFADVLKGLITVEEAHDYPDEAKPRQTKDITPRNPLDAVAKVAIPAMTTDSRVIEQAMEDTVEPEPPEGFATATVATIATDEAEVVEQPSEFALLVPGGKEPFSVHQEIDEWAAAYEELADKTARAGKRPARERMTALRELREINEATINQVNQVMRIRHTANYTTRIKALGAAIP